MGKLPEWSMKDICEVFEARTSAKEKFDVIGWIDGWRGLGKSTLGYKILSRVKIETRFRPKRDILYKRDEILKHLATKTNGGILGDELINVGYKRDFYEEGQKILIKALNMYRDRRNIFLGCIPFFSSLDIALRNISSIRLTVIKRGLALIHMPIKSLYTNDPWDIKNNMKVENEWVKKGIYKPKYSRLSTAKGILRFGDLSPKQREIYEAVKEERRHRIYDEFEDPSILQDPDKLFYQKLLERIKEGKVDRKTFDEICMVSGRKIRSVQRNLNNMLRESGEVRTFKDYVSYIKEGGKKDGLGFKA